jgi:hypothetical protein
MTEFNDLGIEQPKNRMGLIIWLILGFVVGLLVSSCLGGAQGVKVYFAILAIVGYIATIVTARNFFAGVMRLLAGVILGLLGWLMVITALPVQLFVWAKPVARWLSDDVGTSGIWTNFWMLVIAGIVTGGLLIWAGFLYMSDNGLKILISPFLAFPVVFLVLGMVMQENL